MKTALPIQRKHVIAILAVLFVWSYCIIGLVILLAPKLLDLYVEFGSHASLSIQLLIDFTYSPWWLFPCVVALITFVVSRTKINNGFLRILLALTILSVTIVCSFATYALLDGVPSALTEIIRGLDNLSNSIMP